MNWTREISTVPIFHVATQQSKEQAWDNQQGMKTLWELTHVQVSSGKFNVNTNLMWTKETARA